MKIFNLHSDVLSYLYNFLNYKDANKLVHLNKDMYSLLKKRVEKDKKAGQTIVDFFIKHKLDWTIYNPSKKDLIRYIICESNDKLIKRYNCSYYAIETRLREDQKKALLPIVNIIVCSKRNVIQFLTILDHEHVRYLRNYYPFYYII